MKKNNDNYLWRMQNILIITWILMLLFALIARAEYIEVWDSVAVVDTMYEVFSSDTTYHYMDSYHFNNYFNDCPACLGNDTWNPSDIFPCYLLSLDTTWHRVCRKVEWPLINTTITEEQLLKEWKPFEVIYNGCDTIGWEYIGRAGSPCCDSIPVLKCDTVKKEE